jgi:hypothetical protein
MPRKIFISYRRQDAGSNVLGIGQYLENEFGRKNVYIDVDMRAGTNFPLVLQRRLADCRVMLVLIGPDWLNARNEEGRRRLDDPEDWVRVEIVQALKRGITVIPVRVNGAELPARAMLPEEIRGLLDYQAVSVTLAGFRSEMAGLARDIRSISNTRQIRRFWPVATGVALLLTVVALSIAFGLPTRIRLAIPQMSAAQTSASENWNGVWKSSPGEWVFYEVGAQRFAHYFKPSSLKTFGDKVAVGVRYVVDDTTSLQGAAYEDATNVFDCKSSTFAMAERTVYNKSGEIISHFNWADPEILVV